MRLIKISNLLVMLLALSFVAVGCKTGKRGETPLDKGGETPEGTPALDEGGKMKTDGGVGAAGGGDLTSINLDNYNQDRSALAAQTIYFDFDSAAIRSDENSKLTAVASALEADASAKLLIEGSCDERGTEEYNRSLGERRALAVREALVGLGLNAGRIATRSYGEDKPADPGHEQSAWAKNRRAEFILLHPK